MSLKQKLYATNNTNSHEQCLRLTKFLNIPLGYYAKIDGQTPLSKFVRKTLK